MWFKPKYEIITYIKKFNVGRTRIYVTTSEGTILYTMICGYVYQPEDSVYRTGAYPKPKIVTSRELAQQIILGKHMTRHLGYGDDILVIDDLENPSLGQRANIVKMHISITVDYEKEFTVREQVLKE